MSNVLNISSGPHVRDRWSTRFIMGIVFLSLMPATIVGVAVHGLQAFLIILISIVSAVGTEFLFDVLCKKGGIALSVFGKLCCLEETLLHD